jgi:ketosteroid isomerase-like protein
MSPESMDVVRQPLPLRPQTRRRLEERLGLRFPGVVAVLVESVLRLPASSRLRQAFVRRAAQLGFEALNRRDVEAAFVLYHPEVELNLPKEFVGLGLDPPSRGRKERVAFERTWNAQWGQVQYEFQEIIDVADGRVLLLGRFEGTGPISGAGFGNEFAEIFTFSGGHVIREDAFSDHAEALEAVGLSE